MAEYGAQHYLDACRLAIEGAANDRTAQRVIAMILDAAPEGEPAATEPTRILIQAIRDADGDIVIAESSDLLAGAADV